jgi:hypothetical protein
MILCLFGATSLGYYLYNQMDKQHEKPDIQKIRKAILRFGQKFRLQADGSEEDVEKQLAKYLQIHFRQVRRQFPVGEFSQRERIDIDIADGTFGIEIKLASLLKKTNERNRVFGQIDTYQSRRYGKHRLLVVIVGEAGWDKSPIGIEMKQILQSKGAGLVFLQVASPQMIKDSL